MTALHLVFTHGNALDSALAMRLPDEPVALLGDGVYALLSAADNLQALSATGGLVLLQPDVQRIHSWH
jgi:sulfur transfer complex TusBCD TusB component (DsrH family)